MAAAALTNLSNCLKVTAGKAGNLAMAKFPIWQLIKDKTTSRDIRAEGKSYYFYRNFIVENGDNARNTAENATLGTYDPTTADQARWPLVDTTSMLSISNIAKEAGGLQEPGNADIASKQEEGMLSDWRVKMMSEITGQHQGWITRVRGASTTTTVYVHDTDLIKPGQRLEIYTVSGGTWTQNTNPGSSGTITVTQVHPTSANGPYIVISANGNTIADGSFLVYDGMYNICNYGIGDAVQANADIYCGSYYIAHALTTYANLSRDTYPAFSSLVYQPDGAGGLGDISISRLFTWLAHIAGHQGEGVAAVTDIIGHPLTMVHVWEKLAPAWNRQTNAPQGVSLVIGAKGEATLAHPTLKYGAVTFHGHIGWKKYCLHAFDFNDPEAFVIRHAGEPHYIDKGGEGGIFSYDGYPGGYHTWSAVYDYLWGPVISPRACSVYAGVQLPADEQTA